MHGGLIGNEPSRGRGVSDRVRALRTDDWCESFWWFMNPHTKHEASRGRGPSQGFGQDERRFLNAPCEIFFDSSISKTDFRVSHT